MSAQGKFFAIGQPQWDAVCKLNINAATALLVLASGTGRDNRTTSWSAKAVETRAGIGWRRANDAIALLVASKIVTLAKKGNRPRYKIEMPDDPAKLIWLPSELVTGAGAEIPPVARLKQSRDLDLLATFVALYAHHDLTGEGGLPRNLVCAVYDREQLATHGQFVFFGFRYKTGTAWHSGPFEKYRSDPKEKSRVWDHIGLLTKLGLLECIAYLAESADADADLIHALSGDSYAQAAAEAAQMSVACKDYLVHKSENFDFSIPVFSHMTNAAVVGVYRLRYRPKTTKTAAWFAKHVEQCKAFENIYSNIFATSAAA